MNIPLDHECFQWIYSTSQFNGIEFYFKYDLTGRFGYVTVADDRFHNWNVSEGVLSSYLHNWVKLKPSESFCGPMQPPPSKVILKIRQMEARRKTCSM